MITFDQIYGCNVWQDVHNDPDYLYIGLLTPTDETMVSFLHEKYGYFGSSVYYLYAKFDKPKGLVFLKIVEEEGKTTTIKSVWLGLIYDNIDWQKSPEFCRRLQDEAIAFLTRKAMAEAI